MVSKQYALLKRKCNVKTHSLEGLQMWRHSSKMKSDDYFFLNKNNKIYPSTKFSQFTQNVFKIKVGKKININCLRKIKESAIFLQNKKIFRM